MTCASVTIRLRGLMYVNLVSQSVTYVSGTFVTLDSGLNTIIRGGAHSNRSHDGLSRSRFFSPRVLPEDLSQWLS